MYTLTVVMSLTIVSQQLETQRIIYIIRYSCAVLSFLQERDLQLTGDIFPSFAMVDACIDRTHRHRNYECALAFFLFLEENS